MRMKNKMKNYEAKYEEWWEVAKEYFTKETKKNLVQHRADENILRYKLEAYQTNFPIFICGNLTNTKVSDHDEENEVGPQEDEMQIEKPHDFKSGVVHEEEVQPKKPQDL